ncbi:MAG: hypothetical protein GY811_03825 [Myxococcales bacterium]|nr:hypothetical protein [Myxococcales bacterium]
MFGTLRPTLCKLPREDRKAYRRAYCGTCKALGDGYGQLARPLLSYDIVFLAALVEATRSEESETSSCRCPLLPVLQKDIVSPQSTSMKVAAAIQVVLASAWFDDQVQDGNPLFRPARALARGKAEKAQAELLALGMDLRAARDLGRRQAELELRSRDLRELAAPTSDVLKSVTKSIPNLPGSIDMDSNARDNLNALAGTLGLAIYAVDALEDLQGDVECGQFNPCIGSNGAVDASAVRTASATLRETLEVLEEVLGRLSLARGEAGIRAAAQGLQRRARRAISAAEEHLEQWKTLRHRLAPIRWAQLLWTSLLWLPLWFVARGKHAIRRIRRPAHSASCQVNHAYVAHGSPGLGGGSHPTMQAARARRKKKRKDSDKADCCCDCADCGCDCCCCLTCCADSDGGGDGCDCCGDGCCDCGDCCSCDC